MSNAVNLLQLQDIHLPQAIASWPLAPGWYVFSLLILALFVLVFYYGRRAYQKKAIQRYALACLQTYEKNYLAGESVNSVSAKVSELLKQVALYYFPRHDIAGLTGAAWLQFLETSKPIADREMIPYLLDLPYQNQISQPVELTPLFVYARQWIKQQKNKQKPRVQTQGRGHV